MKIAVIAPSAGLGQVFPHMVDLAVEKYKKYYNIDVELFETIKMTCEDVLNNPKKRAEDMNKAFYDESIDYVHSLIGGNDSVRILDFIDLDAPDKVIIGFSDATPYLSYLAINGKTAYYGASILAGMAEMDFLGEKFIKHFDDVVIKKEKEVVYPIYDFYVDGFKDWNDKNNKGELLEKTDTEGPRVLNGQGKVSGKLWGGCMDSIEQFKQIKYYPSEKYLTDKIIFFETSEDKPSPDLVKRWVRNYAMQGLFNRNKAVIFGNFAFYNDEEKEQVYKYIKDIISEYNEDLPVVVNCPIGHTYPTWVLPYNEVFEIDLDNLKFTLKR
ncbi:MAG: LD-carboxypeptidase [Lachnospirales bacterium]